MNNPGHCAGPQQLVRFETHLARLRRRKCTLRENRKTNRVLVGGLRMIITASLSEKGKFTNKNIKTRARCVFAVRVDSAGRGA